MQQEIRYCTTPDGVRLAYAVTGKGSPIVRMSHWMTHIDYDLRSLIWRHLILGLSHNHQLIRYDARGMGLSQRDVDEISLDRWVSDLETVADALALKQFVLLGISQSAAISIEYTLRHPERVSHLIIYGGFARGVAHQGIPEEGRRRAELMQTMVREGWGTSQEAFRQWFTSGFLPDGTAEQFRAFNELQRVSTSADTAIRQLKATSQINCVDLLPKVKARTLVLHCKGDQSIPFALGQEIAAGIPGAIFVPLEGNDHLFFANTPAHRGFMNAVAEFLGDKPFRGALPGSINFRERLDQTVRGIEQNWLVKVIIVLAAITGCFIFGLEVWRLWGH